MVCINKMSSLVMIFLGHFLFVFIAEHASASKSMHSNQTIFNEKNQTYDLTIPHNKTHESKTDESYNGANKTSENGHPEKHCGTRIESGGFIEDIPMEKLIVPLVIIDVSSKIEADTNYELRMKDVMSLMNNKTLTSLSKGPVLLVFKFNRSKHSYCKHQEKDSGHSANMSTTKLPTISSEVADWITTNDTCRMVVGVGVDLPSICYENCSVYMTLIKAGLYIVKGLNLNYSFTELDCFAKASPQKVHKSNKAPLNITAICSKAKGNSSEEEYKQHYHYEMDMSEMIEYYKNQSHSEENEESGSSEEKYNHHYPYKMSMSEMIDYYKNQSISSENVESGGAGHSKCHSHGSHHCSKCMKHHKKHDCHEQMMKCRHKMHKHNMTHETEEHTEHEKESHTEHEIEEHTEHQTEESTLKNKTEPKKQNQTTTKKSNEITTAKPSSQESPINYIKGPIENIRDMIKDRFKL